MLKYLLLFLTLLAGCEQPPAQTAQTAEPASPPATTASLTQKTLLDEPLQATLTETAAEAIPIWRRSADQKPALLIFSQNPFLLPIPQQARNAALELAKNGSLADFQKQASIKVANPVIHPDMALSLALDAGLFSQIIWVLPQRSAENSLPLESFRQKLLETGSATATEAASFTLTEQQIRGSLRNTPVTVISHRNLAQISLPTLVHIDLSFFKPLYVNEIKTPLHPQIFQVMNLLRAMEQPAIAVTVSLANKTDAVSLQVRFVGNLLLRLFNQPELLQQPLAGNDKRRHQALYLANFFKKEERMELFLSMAEVAPQDASVRYDLFKAASEFKQGTEALAYLADAVKLDPGYALEYLQLAEMALEKKRPEAALQMLDLAAAVDPDNPFIIIEKGEILLKTGHLERVPAVLEALLKLPWSELYYPGIRAHLKKKFAAPAAAATKSHPAVE